jgi:redox-sensitive bicupin YhaK (pirin superfamily)
MLWSEQIPVIEQPGARIAVIAGELAGQRAPAPPPRSWAARPDSGVAIWTIKLEAGASWQLPAAVPGVKRTLYFYRGSQLQVAGDTLAPLHAAELADSTPVSLQAGAEACELLVLAGKPIAEPVVQYGPFVMNTRDQIQQAFSDFQRTGFGGWPWPSDAPVHAKDAGRFARHADGKVESAGK